MKKLLLILFLSPLLSQAQDVHADNIEDTPFGFYRWEIGINGGVNITNVAGVDSIQSLDRYGKLYGITIAYHINPYIALKTDLDIEEKGWTFKDVDYSAEAPAGTDVNQYLNYFDVPFFIHAGFGRRLKLDLDFGAYIAFLTDARAFYEDPSTGEQITLTEEAFTGYADTDWGLTYGAGLDFALSNRIALGFDLLIEQGMKAIKGDDMRNQSIDFDFGITFLFGEKK